MCLRVFLCSGSMRFDAARSRRDNREHPLRTPSGNHTCFLCCRKNGSLPHPATTAGRSRLLPLPSISASVRSNVRPPTPRVAWQSVARVPGHRAKRFSVLSFSARSRSARRFSPGESVPRRQGATHPSLGVPEGFLHLRCAPNAHPAQLRRFLFR